VVLCGIASQPLIPSDRRREPEEE